MNTLSIAFYLGIIGIIIGIMCIIVSLRVLYRSIKITQVQTDINKAQMAVNEAQTIMMIEESADSFDRAIKNLMEEISKKDGENGKFIAQLTQMRAQIVEKSIKSEE